MIKWILLGIILILLLPYFKNFSPQNIQNYVPRNSTQVKDLFSKILNEIPKYRGALSDYLGLAWNVALALKLLVFGLSAFYLLKGSIVNGLLGFAIAYLL
jgi:hypothetical protein